MLCQEDMESAQAEEEPTDILQGRGLTSFGAEGPQWK